MLRPASTLVTSTATPVIAHPFVFTDGWPATVPAFLDIHEQQVVSLDPTLLYPRIIGDRNVIVLGDISRGKSSAIKTWIASLLALNRQWSDGGGKRHAWIIDRKREYDELARLYQARIINLGGGTRVNILDNRLPPERRLTLLRQITSQLMGTPMTQFQQDILTYAYEQVVPRTTFAAPGQVWPDVSHIVTALMQVSESDYPAQVKLPPETVHEAASEMFFALRRLTRGELAGLYDGPTSPEFDLESQVCVFQMQGDSSLIHQLIITTLSTWMQSLWEHGLSDNRVDYLVCDEVWEYLNDKTFAGVIRSNFKLGRGSGLCNIILLHRPQDFKGTGSHGEQQVTISENLVQDASTFLIFRMSLEAAKSLQTSIGLSDMEVDTIAHLDPHCALLVLKGTGKLSKVVQHLLLPDDRVMVDTDAMRKD